MVSYIFSYVTISSILYLNIPLPQKETPPHEQSPPSPDNQEPTPVSVDWPVLDVSHQWNHTLCVLLCLLLLLSIVFSGSVHMVVSVWRVTANIVRVSLGGDGMFWVKTVVMVTQHSEYMKTTTVHFKRVSFLVCKLCLKEYCSPLPSLHS